jgi:hypothetical protein
MSDLPLVLFDADICQLLDLSLRTLKRRRRVGKFPIPELPSLDRKHRYARRDVEAFLAREGTVRLVKRRTAKHGNAPPRWQRGRASCSWRWTHHEPDHGTRTALR